MDDSRASRARLHILNGRFEGTSYDLDDREIMIGRSLTTNITLLDEGISRDHALVLFEEHESAYMIEDLASTNGTKLNGKHVRSAALSEGDGIQIGQTLFRFEIAKPDRDSPDRLRSTPMSG
jgi:pSer/pThr/pTyr-binding forkhead associated (FHA) protein